MFSFIVCGRISASLNRLKGKMMNGNKKESTR